MSRRPNWYLNDKKKRRHFWLALGDFFRYSFQSLGLVIWFVVFVLALLEIKRYYNIDVFPGYDSSVDDVYGAARGTISKWFD